MEFFLFFLRLFLAAVFTVSGIGKLLDPSGSTKAAKDFGVPDPVAAPIAYLLPIVELAVAILLVFTETSWLGALAGAILLTVFSAGMIVQMVKGNAPDCHCFGQLHSEPVGPKSLIRNGIILLAALGLIIAGKGNQGLDLSNGGFGFSTNLDVMQLLIGLAVIGLLGAIIYFLREISGQQVKLLRRMDVLEVLVQEDISTERDNLGHPDDGLPLGAPAPGFHLPDATGKIVEFTDLLARRKPLLFFFVSPNCDPCTALISEIEGWAKEFGNRFEFVFISSGKAEENLKKFSVSRGATILLQQKREVAEELGAVWTPTLLLVNSDGTIGSRIATGDAAIRELIKKIKDEGIAKDDFYITNNNGSLRKSYIGQAVPEFVIEDLRGHEIRAENLRGKKTLVAFWSMHCPHCMRMLDDLRNWDKQKSSDEPNLLVFSDGEADEHGELELDSPILLEKDYKTAIKLGMVGTPSAVLVNEKGVIISETAIGAPQIWALIGKRK